MYVKAKDQVKQKAVPASYNKKWTALNAGQQNKIVVYFQSLHADVAEKVINDSIVAKRCYDQNPPKKPQERQTTKNEIARIMHMMADPKILPEWTGVFRGYSDRRRCVYLQFFVYYNLPLFSDMTISYQTYNNP